MSPVHSVFAIKETRTYNLHATLLPSAKQIM